jgi:hypothetical protein
MLHIAMATCHRLPKLASEDRLVSEQLRRYGIETSAVVWNDAQAPWDLFDAVIIRSCWDYHYHPADFAAWTTRLEQKRTPLWNPAALVRWNMDKTYLRDLQRAGIPIVPTVWLAQGAPADLAAILQERDWAQAVVKPSIAATAFGAWRTNRDHAETDQNRLDLLLEQSGVLVQPFVESVCTHGEWSLIFLGGNFSHAVLKQAQSGDFRVQDDFGGSVLVTPPAPALIAQAKRVVDTLVEAWLYARVDGVVVDDTFLLMELELIEPSLFLDSAAHAVERFAQVIANTCLRLSH